MTPLPRIGPLSFGRLQVKIELHLCQSAESMFGNRLCESQICRRSFDSICCIMARELHCRSAPFLPLWRKWAVFLCGKCKRARIAAETLNVWPSQHVGPAVTLDAVSDVTLLTGWLQGEHAWTTASKCVSLQWEWMMRTISIIWSDNDNHMNWHSYNEITYWRFITPQLMCVLVFVCVWMCVLI